MILEQVIVKLVETFRPVAAVDVFDGPVPPAVNKTRYILVGSSAEDEDGATVTLELSELGPGTWHAESGEVICSFWSWSGGTKVQEARADALGLANLCAAAIHADRSLDDLLVPPGLAEVSDYRIRMTQTSAGAMCRVSFSVLYSHLNT